MPYRQNPLRKYAQMTRFLDGDRDLERDLRDPERDRLRGVMLSLLYLKDLDLDLDLDLDRTGDRDRDRDLDLDLRHSDLLGLA